VDKSNSQPLLPSPIRRVFYLSREGTGQVREGRGEARRQEASAAGRATPPANPRLRAWLTADRVRVQEHEVFPPANSQVLTELGRADCVVYGMGSLYTSICPSLCIDGVGEAIAARDVPKASCGLLAAEVDQPWILPARAARLGGVGGGGGAGTALQASSTRPCHACSSRHTAS
jgi:hypothetical protein